MQPKNLWYIRNEYAFHNNFKVLRYTLSSSSLVPGCSIAFLRKSTSKLSSSVTPPSPLQQNQNKFEHSLTKIYLPQFQYHVSSTAFLWIHQRHGFALHFFPQTFPTIEKGNNGALEPALTSHVLVAYACFTYDKFRFSFILGIAKREIVSTALCHAPSLGHVLNRGFCFSSLTFSSFYKASAPVSDGVKYVPIAQTGKAIRL